MKFDYENENRDQFPGYREAAILLNKLKEYGPFLNDKTRSFLRDIISRVRQYGYLTEKQTKSLTEILKNLQNHHGRELENSKKFRAISNTECLKCNNTGTIYAKDKTTGNKFVFNCGCPISESLRRQWAYWHDDYLEKYELQNKIDNNSESEQEITFHEYLKKIMKNPSRNQELMNWVKFMGLHKIEITLEKNNNL